MSVNMIIYLIGGILGLLLIVLAIGSTIIRHEEKILQNSSKRKEIPPMTAREMAIFMMEGKKAVRKKDWHDGAWMANDWVHDNDAPKDSQWADLLDPDFPNWQEFPQGEELEQWRKARGL